MEDSILNRISPFTWETNGTFGSIMKNGGFDWVMGNPPYIRMQVLRKFSSKETDIIQRNYAELKKGNPDIYVAFILRSLEKLKANGSMGFIVSNKFAITEYGEPLRKRLNEESNVRYIVDFGHQQVFDGATTHTCIIVIDKSEPSGKTLVKLVDTKPTFEVFANGATGVVTRTIDLRSFGTKSWELSESANRVEEKGCLKLGDLCEIFQGIRTSDNTVFVLSKTEEKDGLVTGYSRALKRKVTVEADICRQFLRGREIGRNFHAKISQKLIFPYDTDDAYKLIPFNQLKSRYPLAAAYFKACEKQLKKREDGNFDQKNWYGYIYLKNHDLMAGHKVIIQEMAPRAHLTLDRKGDLFFVTGYGLYLKNKNQRSLNHYRFIQAFIKTERLDSRIKGVASKLKAGYQYRKQFMENLPVPKYDSTNPNHVAVCSLQEQLETIGAKILTIKDASIKREYNAQIDSIEKDIEVLAAVIYDGSSASSSDIQRVQEIVSRIEIHLQEAHKKIQSKKIKSLKKA